MHIRNTKVTFLTGLCTLLDTVLFADATQSKVTQPDSSKTRQLTKLRCARSTCHSITLLIEPGDVAQAVLIADGLNSYAWSMDNDNITPADLWR